MRNKYLQIFSSLFMIIVMLVPSTGCAGTGPGRDLPEGGKTPLPKVLATSLPPSATIPPPSLTPTLEPTPEPTDTPEPEVPQPLVILLLGTDLRKPGAAFRTDAIHLMVVHQETKVVKILSIPRDLWVEVPGYDHGRISGVFIKGGFELLAESLALNYGVEPAFFLMVDYWFFPTIVDQLGGIDVWVQYKYCGKKICVKPGKNHMDGKKARIYASDREKTTDIGRQARQWEVMLAIYRKLLSLQAIVQAPELYQTYQRSITTNFTLKDVLFYMPLALAVAEVDDIQHLAINWQDVVSWQTSGGGAVLVAVDDRVQIKFDQLLEP